MIIRRLKKTVLLFMAIFSVAVVSSSCAREDQGPRSVTQKYFNAVKAGDTEGAIKCFTPAFQQQYSALLTLGGMLGESMGGKDGSFLVNAISSYTNQSTYKDVKFKADTVTFTDNEHEHATVHVTVEGGGAGIPSEATINTVKYDGKWYVEP
mgnify:FL=1